MKNVYLINYSVKGIKTIDQLVSLSFYKRTVSNYPETQDYNIKGIYGMNGSGKTGIVTSVDILRNLLINPEYLNNSIVQKNLDAIINKKAGELYIEAEFLVGEPGSMLQYKYAVSLSREMLGKYVIVSEALYLKKPTSHKADYMQTFAVENGELVYICEEKKDEFLEETLKKTTNLLSTASMCALFYEKNLKEIIKNRRHMNVFFGGLIGLLLFGKSLHVYLDEADVHRDYFVNTLFGYEKLPEMDDPELEHLLKYLVELDVEKLDTIQVSDNIIRCLEFERFEQTISGLYKFLKIFKPNLEGIEIDKKINDDVYMCSLIMIYDNYKIHAEFESTGVKKLIKLFVYLREMVQGGIVFIDEFDSNLHDVYLCALLEYLMEYGNGQLCFTTHNVGPMDVLKRHKKSIDFLSEDNKIYSWKTNGNYSPSKLYRNGMIEGSPFNVDSIDFIGVFSTDEEDD